MNARDIWILYKMELRSALRERAIVVYSILMPLFLYPVLLWVMFSAMTFIQGVNEGFVSRVALIGSPPAAHQALVDSLEAQENVEVTRGLSEEEALARIQAGDMDALLTFEAAPMEGAALEENFQVLIRFDRSEN